MSLGVAFAGLRPPFRLVHTDNKKPQSQGQLGDERDPWKIRNRQGEKKPEAIDPVSQAGHNHQQAENSRKKLEWNNKDSNHRAEQAEERQPNAESTADPPNR